jgi:hypothetical protein
VRKGKQHEARADLKAETKLVIDEAKIEIVGPEDLIQRIVDSLPGPGGDLPRLVVNQLANLEHDPKARHALALKWVFRLAATHRRSLARAAGMRSATEVLNSYRLKTLQEVETYLKARGDSKPTGKRIARELEHWGISLSPRAVNRRRQRLRHNSGHS